MTDIDYNIYMLYNTITKVETDYERKIRSITPTLKGSELAKGFVTH